MTVSMKPTDAEYDGLKVSYAAILRLAEGGASYVDIAGAMGLRSVGTVKSKLNRARAALQKLRIRRELAATEAQAASAGLKAVVGGNG